MIYYADEYAVFTGIVYNMGISPFALPESVGIYIVPKGYGVYSIYKDKPKKYLKLLYGLYAIS